MSHTNASEFDLTRSDLEVRGPVQADRPGNVTPRFEPPKVVAPPPALSPTNVPHVPWPVEDVQGGIETLSEVHDTAPDARFGSWSPRGPRHGRNTIVEEVNGASSAGCVDPFDVAEEKTLEMDRFPPGSVRFGLAL